MKRILLAFLALVASSFAQQSPAAPSTSVRPALEQTYSNWRAAILAKNYSGWQLATARSRQAEVRNLIVSEKRAFPSSVFDLPAPPPPITNLQFLHAEQKGPTAKLSYYGNVSFGKSGQSRDTLMVLSFIAENNRWTFDRTEFVSLAALPEVRKELEDGNIRYLKEVPEARPTGQIPPTPFEVAPARIIAKVYVFSPGRDISVQVNKVSRHTFRNAQDAQIVIGGAREGLNEIQYSIQKNADFKSAQPLTIRVYLMSEVKGVKPVKAFEYQVAASAKPSSIESKTFVVDAAMLRALNGTKN